MMSFKEQAKKSPFAVFGAIAASLIAGFGAFRHYGVPDLEAERDTVSRDAARIHANVVNSAALSDHLNALRDLNGRAAARVARANDLAGNTQYFYRIEAETGVREVSLSPAGRDPKKGAGAYTTIAFNSGVEGKLTQVLSFIDRLEGGAWFGRVSNLSLRQIQAVDSRIEPNVAATLSVEILALP